MSCKKRRRVAQASCGDSRREHTERHMVLPQGVR